MPKKSAKLGPKGKAASDPGSVWVVIPTYNEAESLPELVQRIMALGLPGLRILFVDDNSPDGTADLAEELSARYEGKIQVLRRPSKLGLATAYVDGFRHALGAGARYIIEMDADLSHAPEYIPGMLALARLKDVVVGSRWIRGGGVDPSWGLGRRLLSRGGSWYSRTILGLTVRDATTGFKCFRREALAGLDLSQIKSSGFAFQVEMAYLCHRKGHRVAEVPIRFADRARGHSKMSPSIIAEAFFRVLMLRLRPPSQ